MCLRGQTVVSNLFPNEENPVGKIICFNNIPFQVVGVLAAKGQRCFGQDQDDVMLAPYITSASLITYFLHWPTLVSASSIILSFMVCALTGVFFGYYPAHKASRLDPVEALRYE